MVAILVGTGVCAIRKWKQFELISKWRLGASGKIYRVCEVGARCGADQTHQENRNYTGVCS